MKYVFIAVTLLTMSVAIPADTIRANCHDHGGRTLCCCETYGGGTCCRQVLICNNSMIGCGCKN